MRKHSRIFDVFFLWIALALASWLSQPRALQSEPTGSPQPPSANPVSPSPGAAVWVQQGLQLQSRVVRAGQGPKDTTLRVTLRNTASVTAYIPGTFCQEGKDADWWSHGLRVRVSDGRKQWRLGPSYGARELHEHGDNPLTIAPGALLEWEFRLQELDPEGEGWEQVPDRKRLSVVCELECAASQISSHPILL